MLDEPTAHLDSDSEYKVQRALRRALVGRTAIVIAHRLSTVRRADLLLVIDGGRIVELRHGTPNCSRTVVCTKSSYRTQFEDQKDDEEDFIE